MPDITMCANDYCTLRQRCYRYSAPPSEVFQSWQVFQPRALGSGEEVCDHFVTRGIPYDPAPLRVQETARLMNNMSGGKT